MTPIEENTNTILQQSLGKRKANISQNQPKTTIISEEVFYSQATNN